MKGLFVLVFAAAATLAGASAAQAAPVGWSIGIDVPPVVAPAYVGYPSYAPPVLYAPRPRLWLPPLPPLPRLSWYGRDRWHDRDRDGWRDRGHDGWHDRDRGHDGGRDRGRDGPPGRPVGWRH